MLVDIFMLKMWTLIFVTWTFMAVVIYKQYHPARPKGKISKLCGWHTKVLRKGELALVVPSPDCDFCKHDKNAA